MNISLSDFRNYRVLVFANSKVEAEAARGQLGSHCAKVLSVSSLRLFLNSIQESAGEFDVILVLANQQQEQKIRNIMRKLSSPIELNYIGLEDDEDGDDLQSCFSRQTHAQIELETAFFTKDFASRYYFSLCWKGLLALTLEIRTRKRAENAKLASVPPSEHNPSD